MGQVHSLNELYDEMSREDQAEVQAERARKLHLGGGAPICGALLTWDHESKKATVCGMGPNHSGTHL